MTSGKRLEPNPVVARKLREIADLLQQQGANPYRVNAYRDAANTVDQLESSVKEIVERKGIDGLIALPHIGERIARSIYEYVAMERMTRLEGLRGGSDPEALLRTVPGIGPELATRIHDELHVETLEALEMAAHDGSLGKLSGIGERRVAAIQASLASMLGGRTRRALETPRNEPAIELLLNIDREYRSKAAAGHLPTITPKRFNPKKASWLPILHATKSGWHFTALFSNTARAHDLGKTHDWVVIYFYNDQHEEGQHTVVTETHGPLTNQRVVRGRELECREFYDKHTQSA